LWLNCKILSTSPVGSLAEKEDRYLGKNDGTITHLGGSSGSSGFVVGGFFIEAALEPLFVGC
jgi:hypothetical protein